MRYLASDMRVMVEDAKDALAGALEDETFGKEDYDRAITKALGELSDLAQAANDCESEETRQEERIEDLEYELDQYQTSAPRVEEIVARASEMAQEIMGPSSRDDIAGRCFLELRDALRSLDGTLDIRMLSCHPASLLGPIPRPVTIGD